MKRVITILMIATLILLGGMILEAKTTPKRVSARTTITYSPKEFGPDIFLKKGKYYFSMSFRPDIRKSLKQLGFTRSGNIYYKDGIRVEIYSDSEIIITFADESEMDKFIAKTAKLGYERDGEQFKTGHFEIDIWIEDNEIRMLKLPND